MPAMSYDLALRLCHYLPAKHSVAGQRVLDLTCGDGAGVDAMLSWGAASVVGLDPSPAKISHAQTVFADRPQAGFQCSDPVAFLRDQGAEFDVIIATRVMHQTAAPADILAALAVHDAVVILSCPNTQFLDGRGAPLDQVQASPVSFYDMRSLTQRYLGPAAWYLGTSNTGFSAVAADPILQDVPSPDGEVTAVLVPADQVSLKPSTALFYVGVWGQAALAGAYQTTVPQHADVRLPRLSRVSPDIAAGQIRRAAFVIDQHNWAFDNIVRNMQPLLVGRYDITVYCIADYTDQAELLCDLFVTNTYDNVHYMWRESLFFDLADARIMMRLLAASKLDVARLTDRLAAPVLTTSVYDHLFLRPQDVAARVDHLALVDAYATSSTRLTAAYQAAYETGPAAQVSDGVNVDMFAPARAAQGSRPKADDQVFYVGWVGNSGWGQTNKSVGDDPKGLRSILVPAIERLVLDGYRVSLALADRHMRHRTRAQMVTYYGEIDVLVCASDAEGTPNPVLEAMASGVPFISTDVGIVAQVAGPLQSQFIIQQRDVQAMYDMIKRMIDVPDMRRAIAAENVVQVQAWDWSAKTVDWLHLLGQGQDAHAAMGRRMRRMVLGLRFAAWQEAATLEQTRRQLTEMQKATANQSLAHAKQVTRLQDQQRAELAAHDKALRGAQAEITNLKVAGQITPQHLMRSVKRRLQKLVGR